MTFPVTFWKPQNPGIQVQIFEYLKKTLRILDPKSSSSDPNFGFLWFQIRVFQVRFSKKSAERAWFETSKIRSLGIDPNRLESLQTARKRLGFEVSRASRPIRPQNLWQAFSAHTGIKSDAFCV